LKSIHIKLDQRQGNTVIVQQRTNGIGTAGFVLALISLLFSWLPFVGWTVWFLGLLFSFIGIFRRPRGLAIAGLCISLICVIVLLVVFAGIGLAAAASAAAL